jgi:tetratricopeptide (TPR) repeat protein
MKLKKCFSKPVAIAATTLSLTFAPVTLEKPMGLRAAYAQASAKYNPSTNPFVAGSIIKAMAKNAASAKELHEALRKKLKTSSSGATLRDDRAPRTAQQTMQKGGDCTEFTYAGIALFKSKGIETGALIIKVGRSLHHVLQFAVVDGKRTIIDPQTKEFGKGRIKLKSGKTIIFDYDQAVKKLKAAVLTSNQAAGLYHMEWGNFLKNKASLLNSAIKAFKRALEINPNDNYSKKQLNALQGRFVNKQMDLGVKAYNNKDFAKALTHFKAAMDNFPANASKKHKAQLQGLIKQCEGQINN